MLDKLLLDDEDFQVNLGLAGLGAITISLKKEGLEVKALPVEKQRLNNAFNELESDGIRIEPGNEHVERAVRDFAIAVVARARAEGDVP